MVTAVIAGPASRQAPRRASRPVAAAPSPGRFAPRRRRHAPEVYRRRRTVVAGVLVVGAVALWLAVQGLLGGSSSTLPASRPVVARSVVVRPGDTIWSIAQASGAGGDIRPLVDELSAEVHGQPLQPGEVISVP